MLPLTSSLGISTILGTLVFTQQSLASDGGPYTLHVQPSVCTKSVFSYSTKLTIPTDSSVVIEFADGLGGGGEVWNFAADSDHNITSVAEGGGRDKITGVRNKDGSYNLTSHGGSTPVMALCEGPGPKCNLSITNHNLKCNKPVADFCTKSHDTNVSQVQWSAWKVDDFMEGYITNFTNNKDPNKKKFMEQFFSDFLGDNGQFMCSTSDDSHCVFPTDCADIKTTGPYAMQAYQMLAALENLSRVLSTTYAAFTQAEIDLGIYIPIYVKAVTKIPPKPVSWQQIFAIISSIFTAIAVPVIAVEGPAMAVGALIGASTAAGGSANIANLGGDWQTEFLFEDLVKEDKSLINYITHAKDTINNIHNQFFQDAKNLIDVLKFGNWVSPDLMRNTGVNSGGNSNFTKIVSEHLEHIFITGLINQIYLDSQVMVTWVPYGQVTTPFDKGTVSFTKDDCNKDYSSGVYGQWWVGGTVKYYVWCSETGMAQFNSNNGLDYDWFNMTFSMNGYTYDPNDVLKGSVNSFFKGGYKYNATQDQFNMLTRGQPIDDVSKWSPVNAGVFNVPVCVSSDLGVNPWVCQASGKYANGICSGLCACRDSTARLPNFGRFIDNIETAMNDTLWEDCYYYLHAKV